VNTLFFLLVCGVLLLLPFLPAWYEWRHPTDNLPLPVPHDADSVPGHFARLARAGTVPPEVEYSEKNLCCRPGTTHRALFARGWIQVRDGARILDWAHADGGIRLWPGSV
jgi:hypothetical protein